MRAMLALAATFLAASIASSAGFAAAGSGTPFPPIAANKTSCPKTVYTVSKYYTVNVVIAAQKGHHPIAALLTCASAYKIALAGKKHYSKVPFRTGAKIVVDGATYTAAVGGPDVWPATSGPVYGWFGNGIEILLMIPSGR